jgi:hypothetical protein
MFDSIATYMDNIGIDVASTAFQVSFDSTRVVDLVQFDSRRSGILGFVAEDYVVPFDTFDQAQRSYSELETAKFVVVFLLLPLDGNIPSAYRIAAVLPQPASFDYRLVRSWVHEVLVRSRAAGFRIVSVGADGDSRHRKLALEQLRTLSGQQWVGQRLDSVLSLFPIMGGHGPVRLPLGSDALAQKGTAVSTCILVQHVQARNNLMSMSRVLVIGDSPILLSHILDVFSTFGAGLRAQERCGQTKRRFG